MSSKPKIIRSIQALRKIVACTRTSGKTIALVPTMGALHEGHLSLVKLAKTKCDIVIASIFVNPTQFGQGEDLSTYPRDSKGDQAKLAQLGTDIIYLPKAEQMYPEGFATTVTVTDLTNVLCGVSRPTHFAGVATVVTKLLLQCLPDIAIFGEKDYQQLLVIKRFVQDLNIPVKILGGPIIRETDGLALSSRNAYLTKAEREVAPKLNETLLNLRQNLYARQPLSTSLTAAKRRLKTLGFDIDYLEVRDVKDLSLITKTINRPARIFVAAYLGTTRLIDNIPVRSVAQAKP